MRRYRAEIDNVRAHLRSLWAVIGLQFGIMLGAAILTETVFAWPGVGKWIFDGVVKRDYMVIQGGTLIVA